MGDLCTACMCTGRNLYYIGETGFYHLYSQILNEIQVYDSSPFYIRVCWECLAHLRKWLKFKEQAKRSYTQLQYAQQNNFQQPPEPSHLAVSQAYSYSCPEPHIKTETDEPHCPLDSDRLHAVKMEETHCEPETFVNNLNLEPKKRKGKKVEKPVKKKTKKKIKPKTEKIPIKKKVKVKKKRSPSPDSLEDDHLDADDLHIEHDDIKDKIIDVTDKKDEEKEVPFVKENNFQQPPEPSHLVVSQAYSYSYPEPHIKTETDEPHCPLDSDSDSDRLHAVKMEETYCEPETFVNNLNLEPKKRKGKKVEKPVKEKTKKKIKPKTEKIPIKKKVKVKKKRSPSPDSLEDDHLDADDLHIEHDDIKDKIIDVTDKKDEEKEVPFVKESTRLNGEIKPAKQAPLKEALPERPHCEECGKNFSSRKTYRYHLNVLHKGQNRYPCPRCGKVYQWKSNLGRHLRSHKARDSGELYCETCDKRFASVATYRQHLRVSRRHVPESEFSFMCNECGKKFVNKTRLRDHIDWEHLKKIKFRCQLCNKPFKCHTSLYVHMQNVHRNKEKKDNLCHVCGKSYQNAAKLKYHIVAMHTSETPYQCQQCTAAFGWYSSLYRHVREVHYKMKLQPKKSKKSKKTDIMPSLLPIQVALPPMHQPGPPQYLGRDLHGQFKLARETPDV